MDKVVHFEIPTEDLARAKDFYGSVFGWDLQTMSMGESDYTMVTTTPLDESGRRPKDPGAINGGIMDRSKETPSPVITIGVADIDVSLKEIEAKGGTVVTPKTPIPGMGAFAYFTDTDGNVMGLFESV